MRACARIHIHNTHTHEHAYARAHTHTRTNTHMRTCAHLELVDEGQELKLRHFLVAPVEWCGEGRGHNIKVRLPRAVRPQPLFIQETESHSQVPILADAVPVLGVDEVLGEGAAVCLAHHQNTVEGCLHKNVPGLDVLGGDGAWCRHRGVVGQHIRQGQEWGRRCRGMR